MNKSFLPTSWRRLYFLLGSLPKIFNRRRNLDPVPDDCCVFRLARSPKDFSQKGKILAIQLEEEFQLSTADEESVPLHLSVWAESLTTPQQAYSFLVENRPGSRRNLVLWLPVKEIRDLVGYSDKTTHCHILNVIWVFLFSNAEKRIRDKRPGANGHSGITGLDKESTSKNLTKREAKNLRKDLRSKLAEIASRKTTTF